MKTSFQFATIEFMPYPEHGEFVIVGVLAVSSERELIAKILPANKTKRLGHFFPEIERHVFTSTLRALTEEFSILMENVNGKGAGTLPIGFDGPDAKAFFNVLTSSREGMVRIRARGTGIADHLETWCNKSYDRFVLRTLDPVSDAAERTLTNHIGSLLKQWRVYTYYPSTRVGDDHYHTTFPFAYTPEGEKLPDRVIKPLYLAQDSPTKIMDHGDAWLQKIRRLRQFGLVPDKIIFPVKIPDNQGDTSGDRRDAVDCLLKDFRKEDVVIVPDQNVAELRKLVFVEPLPKDGLFS